MEMFLKMIGGKAQHVPYRGSAPALTDVVTGEIQIMMVDLAVAIPHDQGGQGEGLRRHLADAREVHARYPDASRKRACRATAARGWFSVVARAGTPRPIVDRLNGILIGLSQAPRRQRQDADTFAIDALTSTPDELETFIPAEITKWAQVVKDAGIVPE